MAEERNVGLVRAPETEDADAVSDATKEELQRRMDEARESISQTVSEIKETVVTQYQQVRESISDTLDWREQYRRRPVEFSVGALGVGLVLGYAVGSALVGGRDDDYEEDDYDTAEEDFTGLLDAEAPRLNRVVPASPPRPVSRPAQAFAAASPASAARGASQAMSFDEAESAPAESEPTGPGIFERFKETRAYDRLQQELSTLGDRAVDELSKTAQAVVLPAILGKLKDLIGIDLSTQREVAQRSQLEQQTAKASAATASASDAAGSAGTTPRA